MSTSSRRATSDRRVLVIQHIACEPPAAYEDELVERGIAIHRVQIDEGDQLPDWRALDAIIAMGGPMGANDEDALPWLDAEKRLIADAVTNGLPYWGVCLGAQLLAASLGAEVFTGPAPEVGVYADVTLTRAAATDPVFSGLRGPLTTLQWHSDTFALPERAVLLASSNAYAHQAFRFNAAYGLQFHLEVSPVLAKQWADVPEYADALSEILGPGALPQLIEQLQAVAPQTTADARGLLGRWLDTVVYP